jgi:hypothetical protein
MPQSDSRALIFLCERKWEASGLYIRFHIGDRMVIWSQNKWIVALLVLLILGHWSLILQGISVSRGRVGLAD